MPDPTTTDQTVEYPAGPRAERRLIVAGYLGKWGETDGVVTTYSNLLPFLKLDGGHCDVLAYGPEDDVIEKDHLTVYIHRPRLHLRIDPTRWIDPVYFFTGPGRRLLNTRYDLVQSSAPDPLGFQAWRVARRNQCPLLLIYHTALADYTRIRYTRMCGSLVGNALGNSMHRWVTWYYNQADLILAPSNAVKKQLAESLRPPVEVFSRGVDTDWFTPARRTRTDKRVRAIYVGRVAPEKNLRLLVEIFAKLPEVELMIVGEGPYLDQMKEELPTATYPGRITGGALADAYADADFFVFPSHTDTLGNVVLEGLSSGLPAVVTASMGPKELVDHGVTGFVAPTDDDFENAVKTLATDHDRRAGMGRAARESVGNRHWSNLAERLLELHELTKKLAANGSSPQPRP